jgi:hypothetical protein
MGNDYLKLTDGQFGVFYRNLVDYTDQKCGGTSPEWTHIPIEERRKLRDAYTAWTLAYEKTTVPHSEVETTIKAQAKEEARAVIRSFVNRFLREDWQMVRNADRIYMGIPTKSASHTMHPPPVLKPVVEAFPSGRGKHTVRAVNPETGDKRKPDRAPKVVFGCKVRAQNEPKTRAEDMPSEFQSSTTRYFQWSEEFYGKVADYSCAYENESGKRGPWSDVESVIIA